MTEQSWLAKRLMQLRTPLQRTGDRGEEMALHYLQQAGLELVERSFLCKGGEIDLVMRDRSGLVFVEVRTRASAKFGGALGSVTPAKQRRMVHAALVYLQNIKSQPACRFDVVAIENGEINWVKNVITA
jgi:putative endonuclease